MEVQISEVSSTVSAVDGDAMLAPRTLETIVRAVLQALEAQKTHDERVRSEQGLGASARDMGEGG